jgi:PhzF family phenazine biosynthesis protein
MSRYHFRLLNVFAESTFGGNALCVFEDARGLDDLTMQALARQFNLSETTFIFPSEQADAKVRIFTTGYEMPFAGHPTLGTAHVLRSLRSLQNLQNGGDTLRLAFAAGIVPVQADGDIWTLTAPTPNGPKITPPVESPEFICAMLGLSPDDLLSAPLWVDTGTDQLLVPLHSIDAVRRAKPATELLAEWPLSSLNRKTAYIFAFDGAPNRVLARYFFTMQGGGVAEDPGTGSACANLGGWLISTGRGTGRELPVKIDVSQGEMVGRPCHLHLNITVQKEIQVGGRVLELGRGHIDI